MKLDGLITLYKSMKEQDIGRYKFRYQHNQLTFDCLFFIDIEPFELVMGCIGHNFAIFLEVEKGFQIKPFIDPKATFFALLKALKTTEQSDHQFNPVDFFEQFNQCIPKKAKPQNIPSPKDVIKYYPDIEEADKVHFCGWLDNNKQGYNVTPDNLNKTRRLLGQRIYEFAKRRNQSTKWTHIESKAIKVVISD